MKVFEKHSSDYLSVENAVHRTLFERGDYHEGEIERLKRNVEELKAVVVKLLAKQVHNIDDLNEIAGYQQWFAVDPSAEDLV